MSSCAECGSNLLVLIMSPSCLPLPEARWLIVLAGRDEPDEVLCLVCGLSQMPFWVDEDLSFDPVAVYIQQALDLIMERADGDKRLGRWLRGLHTDEQGERD